MWDIYVGYTDNDSMFLMLDESTNRVFHRGRTDVRECLNIAADCMSSTPDPVLNDGSSIDYVVQLPQPFQDSMSEGGKAQVMAHAAWHDAEHHEAVSILSVSTKSCPLHVWMCTRLYLMESPNGVAAWDILARFIAYG